MRRLGLTLVVFILASVGLTACQSGVPQEQYDQLASNLESSQQSASSLRSAVTQLQETRGKAADQLEQAQAEVALLQAEIVRLQEERDQIEAGLEQQGEQFVQVLQALDQRRAIALDYLQAFRGFTLIVQQGREPTAEEATALLDTIARLGDVEFRDLFEAMVTAQTPLEAQTVAAAWLEYTLEKTVEVLFIPR